MNRKNLAVTLFYVFQFAGILGGQLAALVKTDFGLDFSSVVTVLTWSVGGWVVGAVVGLVTAQLIERR